ncbi:hypothetical protein L209DRAFT_182317 [Thermothelomyces heterothallicus CBS 203.75]
MLLTRLIQGLGALTVIQFAAAAKEPLFPRASEAAASKNSHSYRHLHGDQNRHGHYHRNRSRPYGISDCHHDGDGHGHGDCHRHGNGHGNGELGDDPDPRGHCHYNRRTRNHRCHPNDHRGLQDRAQYHHDYRGCADDADEQHDHHRDFHPGPTVTQTTTTTLPPVTVTLPGSTVIRDVSVCPAPTNTAPVPRPQTTQRQLWGCDPGYVCNLPKPAGCNLWAEPPDRDFVCDPRYCQPAPPVPDVQWPKNGTGYFPPVEGYFNLNPNAFGLSYEIFELNEVVTKIGGKKTTITTGNWVSQTDLTHFPPEPTSDATGEKAYYARDTRLRKRDETIVPAVCFLPCNLAFLETQRVGLVPELCEDGSPFLEANNACLGCIETNSLDLKTTLRAYLGDEFSQFWDFCDMDPAEPPGQTTRPPPQSQVTATPTISSSSQAPPNSETEPVPITSTSTTTTTTSSEEPPSSSSTPPASSSRSSGAPSPPSSSSEAQPEPTGPTATSSESESEPEPTASSSSSATLSSSLSTTASSPSEPGPATSSPPASPLWGPC